MHWIALVFTGNVKRGNEHYSCLACVYREKGANIGGLGCAGRWHVSCVLFWYGVELRPTMVAHLISPSVSLAIGGNVGCMTWLEWIEWRMGWTTTASP